MNPDYQPQTERGLNELGRMLSGLAELPSCSGDSLSTPIAPAEKTPKNGLIYASLGELIEIAKGNNLSPLGKMLLGA